MNRLEHCLEQWIDLPDYKLWYNSNHVIIIESGIDLHDKGYALFEEFGLSHLLESFPLEIGFRDLLIKYFDQKS
jgi:hypothetical protein